MSGAAISGAALAVSFAAHAWLIVTSSQGAATLRRPRPPAFVQLTVSAPEPVVAPEPTPPPPKAAPKPIVPAAKPIIVAASEPPPPTPDTPTAAPPPELTGTTLVTADDRGDGWSAPQGTGNARDGLVRSGAVAPNAPRLLPNAGPASQTAPPAPPEALPLAQLSRKPIPPSLAATLERNYPPAARSIGQSGDASVRARIEPSGSIRLASIVSETSAGFGDACRRTLLASKWSAPLDRSGKPVATWISYRCKFRVDH